MLKKPDLEHRLRTCLEWTACIKNHVHLRDVAPTTASTPIIIHSLDVLCAALDTAIDEARAHRQAKLDRYFQGLAIGFVAGALIAAFAMAW